MPDKATQPVSEQINTDFFKNIVKRVEEKATAKSNSYAANAYLGQGEWIQNLITQGGFFGTAFPKPRQDVKSQHLLASNTGYNNITFNRTLLTHLAVTDVWVQKILFDPIYDCYKKPYKIVPSYSRVLKDKDVDALKHVNALDEQFGATKAHIEAIKYRELFGGAAVFYTDLTSDSNYFEQLKQGNPLSNLTDKSKINYTVAENWQVQAAIGNDCSGVEGQHLPFLPDVSMRNSINQYFFYNPVNEGNPFFNSGVESSVKYNPHYKVHWGRASLYMGVNPPLLLKPLTRNWGISMLETYIEPINRFKFFLQVLDELLSESKFSIYSLEGLNQAFQTNNEAVAEGIIDKITGMDRMKSMHNSVVLDAKDSMTYKQINFAGLTGPMDFACRIFASSARQALSSMFSMQTQGWTENRFETETENNYKESHIRQAEKIRHKELLLPAVAIACGKTDVTVSDFDIEYAELQRMKPEDKVSLRKDKVDRVLNGVNQGVYSTEEAKQMIEDIGYFKDNA